MGRIAALSGQWNPVNANRFIRNEERDTGHCALSDHSTFKKRETHAENGLSVVSRNR